MEIADKAIGSVVVREYESGDVDEMMRIWNEVVEDGATFPQDECLDREAAAAFFAEQTYCGVAVAELGGQPGGHIAGLYIVHPNGLGRSSHVANASYAVDKRYRGLHIGEQLVRDSLISAGECGFRMMQFNGVVDSNVHAYNLYRRIGFTDVGIVPGSFRNKRGEYEDMHIMCIEL